MAATEKQNIWVWQGTNNNAPRRVIRKIAASQGIFMPMAPCYVSQSGTVKLADTSDGSDAWHGFIVGVKNKGTQWPITAELAANTEVEIILIDQDQTYAVYVESGSADATAPQTIVGDQYGMTVSTTAGQIGYTTMALDNANATVKVVDIAANQDSVKFDVSDSPGVALVQFLDAVVEAAKA